MSYCNVKYIPAGFSLPGCGIGSSAVLIIPIAQELPYVISVAITKIKKLKIKKKIEDKI